MEPWRLDQPRSGQQRMRSDRKCVGLPQVTRTVVVLPSHALRHLSSSGGGAADNADDALAFGITKQLYVLVRFVLHHCCLDVPYDRF